MLPSIHVFGIHIPSYALMLGIGIASFLLLFLYQFRDLYRSDRVTFNRLLFVTLLSVVALGVSAAFFNSLFHSIEEKKLVIGGITWLGGVVGAIATFLVLTHYLVPKKRGYTFETLSAMMPGMALAHAFGRVGCFLGGCCYGRVSNSPLAVVYPANSSAGVFGTGRWYVCPENPVSDPGPYRRNEKTGDQHHLAVGTIISLCVGGI